MAKINEIDLKNHIKNRSFSPVYFIYGDEPYYIHYYVNKILDSAVLEFKDFNVYKAEGDDIDINQIINTCVTMPMMNDYRVAIVRDFDFLENNDGVDKLLEYIKNPSSTTVLILYFIVQHPTKKGKWKELISLAELVGSVVEIKKKSSEELAKILCKGAGKRGCQMSINTANHIVFCCGDDLFTLFGELEKLCSFKQGGEITMDDVDIICSKTVNAKAYYIAKEINRKNTAKALSIFSELYDAQKDANYLIYPLSSPYIDMYNYLLAKNSGKNPVQFAAELGYKKPETITYSQNQANALGIDKVEACIDVLFECDRILKNVSSIDEKILLENAIVKLCEIVKSRNI